LSYICAIDTGGTFTDCVVLDTAGTLVQAKAHSTPENFSYGVFHALEGAAEHLDLSITALLEETDHLLIGTTIGTNAMVQASGASVGMIATRGHGDAIRIMRGHGRVAGRPPAESLAPYRTDKPPFIVARANIVEVDERIDCFGDVVVPLNLEQVRDALERLRAEDVNSIAVCFLWSFMNLHHEQSAKAIISELAPDIFVCTSSDVTPRWGEYERWAAAAINAYVGPDTAQYLDGIRNRLHELGYGGPLLVMACSGGSLPMEEAKHRPVMLIGSGPVGGISGSAYLSRFVECPNVIAADMGGTSFDVGLIHNFEPVRAATNIVGSYEYSIPNVEVRSIGSGGGSIAWVEELTRRLRVGPASAGALPGPACYGKGGTAATVTDANVVCGLINPDYFLGGAMKLDALAAHRAIQSIAGRLDLDPIATADGIVTISNGHMADLLRRLTVERGLHPEDFVIFSYGGAGGLHASALARELGIRKIIIPLGNAASVWSAFGIASSDLFHVFEATDIQEDPFPVSAVNSKLNELEEKARAQLLREGVGRDNIILRRQALLRYRLQVHELGVSVPSGPLTQRDLENVIDDFERAYEQHYGEGAGYRDAGFELVRLTVEATGQLNKPALPRSDRSVRRRTKNGGTRPVFWAERGDFMETRIYREPDGTIEGPAVIELPTTTVCVREGDLCETDSFGNLVLNVGT
jgi:N-methylhydantoinase A